MLLGMSFDLFSLQNILSQGEILNELGLRIIDLFI